MNRTNFSATKSNSSKSFSSDTKSSPENLAPRPNQTRGAGPRPANFQHIDDALTDEAVNGLWRFRPDSSARRLLNQRQTVHFFLLFVAAGICICAFPASSFIAFNLLATLFFVASIVFRAGLVAVSMTHGPHQAPTPADAALPVITILLPLFKDADALPMLARAISALDYPAEKKEVKLLLEAADPETIFEARRLGLDQTFELIVIPEIEPKTKPKACNFGLHLARGELIVIYDAEDLPERDQLKKAAAAFHRAPDDLVCVQARLNYYNSTDNWLTRLFTLEYALWFDWLLPGLQRLGAPIPLGGTSNFFRTDKLIEAGGWDPFNVTEDADLGLRLARLGLKVEMLDSTTFEEANCRMGNWLRQRSRWMKGYLQTWLVHMRQPRQIIEATGWKGFFAVQLFVAGNLFSALINPLMWTLSLTLIAFRPELIASLYPPPLLALNLFALIAGNLFFVAMMVLAPVKRGWKGLSMFGLTAPLYWLLTSAGAYMALHQAVRRLHYWEKTEHIISAAAKRKRGEALKAFKHPGVTSGQK